MLQREHQQQPHDHVLDHRAPEEQQLAERARTVLAHRCLDLAHPRELRAVALRPRRRDLAHMLLARRCVLQALLGERLAPLGDGAAGSEEPERQLPGDAARACQREVEVVRVVVQRALGDGCQRLQRLHSRFQRHINRRSDLGKGRRSCCACCCLLQNGLHVRSGMRRSVLQAENGVQPQLGFILCCQAKIQRGGFVRSLHCELISHQYDNSIC